MIWRKLNGEILLHPIKDAVKKVLDEEAKNNTKLKVCIGTDSQVRPIQLNLLLLLFLLENIAVVLCSFTTKKQQQNIILKNVCF